MLKLEVIFSVKRRKAGQRRFFIRLL